MEAGVVVAGLVQTGQSSIVGRHVVRADGELPAQPRYGGPGAEEVGATMMVLAAPVPRQLGVRPPLRDRVAPAPSQPRITRAQASQAHI